MTTAGESAERQYREAGYRATGLWTEQPLGGLVAARAAQHPDRELFLIQGRRITYGEFEVWTRTVAADLVGRGVRPGDRVLVQLRTAWRRWSCRWRRSGPGRWTSR